MNYVYVEQNDYSQRKKLETETEVTAQEIVCSSSPAKKLHTQNKRNSTHWRKRTESPPLSQQNPESPESN